MEGREQGGEGEGYDDVVGRCQATASLSGFASPYTHTHNPKAAERN